MSQALHLSMSQLQAATCEHTVTAEHGACVCTYSAPSFCKACDSSKAHNATAMLLCGSLNMMKMRLINTRKHKNNTNLLRDLR